MIQRQIEFLDGKGAGDLFKMDMCLSRGETEQNLTFF